MPCAVWGFCATIPRAPQSVTHRWRFIRRRDSISSPIAGSDLTARHLSPDDIVFPAISRHTCQFLETLPQYPCEDLLDLCSGTGVAALVAVSRYARRAWAVDITERATRCAEFNILLNDLTQVTAIQGDLYAPLNGRMFDRIVAHPPYVPVMKPSKIYYDGGEDGERVTRAIIAGLPQHLKPGGSFYCLTMG